MPFAGAVSSIEPNFWDDLLTKEEVDFRAPYSGKLHNSKIDNFSDKDVDLSSIIQSSSNCNLMSSVCGSTNKLSYFKPIQTSAKFATLDTVLTHFLTLRKLASILKPSKPTTPKPQSDYVPNLLKSVPGVETFEHFLAPAHHRYQTVEIVQLAKQLIPTSGDCNEHDDQRSTSTESAPKIETNVDFHEADSASTPTISRSATPTTKSNNTVTTMATPTTITPHIQKIGQPTTCSTVSFNRTSDSVSIPTATRNNSVAVVFVKNSDGQQQSVDGKRSETTVIKNNSEQQQQKVVQLSANQQNSPQLAKILNKPLSQPSPQPHLLQILNAPPSRNLNNNLFTATATNGNIVSGGNSGNIMTFSSNNGTSATLPNNLYICKTDGKTIQLTPLTNNRLMTTSMSNVKTALNGFYINNNLKKTVNQVADEVKVASTQEVVVQSTKTNQATLIKSQISTRSVYEENYAKFIQTASQKSSNDVAVKTSTDNVTTVQSNALPKFNHAFGKTILSSDTIAATQTKTTTSTITLTVSDDDNDPNNVSVSQDAATQTNATVSKGKHSKKILQTFIKDSKTMSDASFANDKQKQQVSANHVIYSRQPITQSTIVQGINRMIQSSGGTTITTNTLANKNDIKIISQPMSSLATGMRISMPIVSSSMQQLQTKLIRPVIQLPPTILRSTGQGEHRQQFLITTPSDPSSNVRYENLIVTAQSAQSSSNRNVDTSTLEQLREFDMVLEQVKERSTTTLIATPSVSSNIAVNTQSVNQLMTSGNNQIIQTASPDIIYTTSNGQSVIQKFAYVQQHNLHNTPLVVVTNYCQPSSSNTSQKAGTSVSTSSTPSITTLTSPKCKNAVAQIAATQTTLKLTPKLSGKPVTDRPATVASMLPKYTSTITAVTNSISSTAPITTTNVVTNNNASISITSSSSSSSTPSKPPPKLQEDEQTVQRIYNILAEYAEQLRNSPDLNNKPAPRRRCNIPSNTSSTAASSSNASTTSNTSSTSKKRKSSQSSSSKRSNHDNELDRTMESEDSSGVSLHDQNNSDDASQHSLSNTVEKSPPVLITSVPNSCIGLSSSVLTPVAARSATVSRQLIFADSMMTLGTSVTTTTSTSTVSNARQVLVSDASSGLTAKVGNETVLMPRNYVLPMSVIKSGGQQYAIVASSAQASKLLETGQIKHVGNELWQQQRSNQQGAIVLQGFLNKNVVRTTGSVQTETPVKQQLKVHKTNVAQTFEVGSTLCRPQGNSAGAFILQTIPTTMISSPQSTILTNLVASDSQNLSAFARVPQQSKPTRTIDTLAEETKNQPSRGIIIIENVKEESKPIVTATTTSTLITKKRKFGEDDIVSNQSVTQNEWSSDQYLDQTQGKSVYLVDSTDSKIIAVSSPTQHLTMNASKSLTITNASIDTPKVTTQLTPTASSSDENLRFLISNPYQACPKAKTDQRGKQFRNNFILNTNGSSSGNRILLQQLCHERKQAAIERELRLQKSLSEECEDLGVGEPSTSDLFPEADLLFDTCSPAFDHDALTPIDTSKGRVFFQVRSNDGDDSKSDDDEKYCKLRKVIDDSSSKGSSTPIFLRTKDDTMDLGIISPYVQENSSSSGGTNDKHYLEPIEIKKEETDNDDNDLNDDAEQYNSDSTGNFDKLKNSMDWEGGPKKTYSKSSVRVVKRPQELTLTSSTKISCNESQPTLMTISEQPLNERKITQYHNKKKIPLNQRLSAMKSPKNDIIIVQRKRQLALNHSINETDDTVKATSSNAAPYIHNHSIGSNMGNISSSFKIINSTDTTSSTLTVPSSTSNSPKIINHQMRRCNTKIDEDIGHGHGTLNGANVKSSKQVKRR